MNDRELLEMAAKAAGVNVWTDIDGKYYSQGVGIAEVPWNPLTDDGDALRLAMLLRLNIQVGKLDGTVVATSNIDSRVYEAEVWEAGDTPNAATRRAIVRAAAQIVSASKPPHSENTP